MNRFIPHSSWLLAVLLLLAVGAGLYLRASTERAYDLTLPSGHTITVLSVKASRYKDSGERLLFVDYKNAFMAPDERALPEIKQIFNAFKNQAEKTGVKAVALRDVIYSQESSTAFNTTYVIRKNTRGQWLPGWEDSSMPDLQLRPW